MILHTHGVWEFRLPIRLCIGYTIYMATIEFLRQFRIAGYAMFDLGASFLGIYLLAPLLSRLFLRFRVQISRKSWLLLTLPLSIVVHLLVGTMTLMTKNFLDVQGHYVLKIVILVLFILGMKDIKIIKKNKKKRE